MPLLRFNFCIYITEKRLFLRFLSINLHINYGQKINICTKKVDILLNKHLIHFHTCKRQKLGYKY